MPVELANGPRSADVDSADAPDHPACAPVVDAIAAPGYHHAEGGLVGDGPEDPAGRRNEVARCALSVAGRPAVQPPHDPVALAEGAA